MPTVETITEALVWVHIARGMLWSLLCQSKNGEVLNTFHTSIGRGAHNAIRKSGETLCMSIPQAGFTARLCMSSDAASLPIGQSAKEEDALKNINTTSMEQEEEEVKGCGGCACSQKKENKENFTFICPFRSCGAHMYGGSYDKT